MPKVTLHLFILLTLLWQPSFGQEKKQYKVLDKEYTIPFRITDYNNFSIQAKLNEKDTVNLMFHTAANAVTLTEEATKRLKTIHFAGADSVKSWGGSDNSSRFSKSNLLQLGELTWDNVPLWENKNSGQQTDGKFGIDLFENNVIELDFDKKNLILRSNLPDKIERYDKLKLTFENDLMFIEASCEIDKKIVKNKFLLHSGYSGDVLLDDQFIQENKIDEKLKTIAEKELKDSFGNVLKTKKAILPAFTIGNKQLDNVPVGFFTGAIGRQKMSIIGGDLLKRFNIVIDAKREYIYLKANDLVSSPYFNG